MPERSNQRFINPYHFVPLGDTPAERKDYVEQKSQKSLLTGYLDCELETLTPLFIPNTTRDNTFTQLNNQCGDAKNYDFHSTTLIDQEDPAPPPPVIPGSEIRGCIRSAYEALTNSCMALVDEDTRLYRRSNEPFKKSGLLNWDAHKKEWNMQPCKRYGVPFRKSKGDKSEKKDIDLNNRLLNELRDGSIVYFQKNGNYIKVIYGNNKKLFPVAKLVERGGAEAYFCKGENFGKRKHHYSILVKNNEDPIPVSEKAVQGMLDSLKLYRDDRVNQDKDHRQYDHIDDVSSEATLEDLKKSLSNRQRENREFPIHYKEVGSHHYLSPAIIGREVFHHTFKDLLKTHHKGCSDKSRLCPACLLFGMVSEKSQVATRIRFSDAKWHPQKDDHVDSCYHQPVYFKELSSPKISSTEMYLQGYDGAVIWNYDYAKDQNNELINGYKARLQGRKFYWHQPSCKEPPAENSPTERNTGGRALKKGNTFAFRVHFNGLTESELKQLCLVFDPNPDPQTPYALKMGMGKPLGMGSVKFRVQGVAYRQLSLNDRELTYKWKKEDPPTCSSEQEVRSVFPVDDAIWQAFQRITRFEVPQHPIEYPSCDLKNFENIPPEDERKKSAAAGYNWFVHNRKKEKALPYCFHENLQSLQSNNDVSLPKYTPLLPKEKNQKKNPIQGRGKQKGRNRRRQ